MQVQVAMNGTGYKNREAEDQTRIPTAKPEKTLTHFRHCKALVTRKKIRQMNIHCDVNAGYSHDPLKTRKPERGCPVKHSDAATKYALSKNKNYPKDDTAAALYCHCIVFILIFNQGRLFCQCHSKYLLLRANAEPTFP